MDSGEIHLFVPGAPKAATTWYQHVLDWNDATWVPPDRQEVRFFDIHHEDGHETYRELYDTAGEDQVTADVSPSYLAKPEVPERIATFVDASGIRPRFVISVRNPVERWVSDYRMRLRKGGDESPREALEDPLLRRRGRYHTTLQRYLDYFDEKAFLVIPVEELRTDTEDVLHRVAEHAGLSNDLEDPYEGRRVNAGGRRRIPGLEASLRLAGKPLRSLGLTKLLHRVKRSRPIQALYDLNRADDSEAITIPPDVVEELRGAYRPEVEGLAERIDRPDLLETWGYK